MKDQEHVREMIDHVLGYLQYNLDVALEKLFPEKASKLRNDWYDAHARGTIHLWRRLSPEKQDELIQLAWAHYDLPEEVEP
jgi:hypothetical protein